MQVNRLLSSKLRHVKNGVCSLLQAYPGLSETPPLFISHEPSCSQSKTLNGGGEGVVHIDAI